VFAYDWSVVATTSCTRWLLSTGRTMPASDTDTSTGLPSAGSDAIRTGATAAPGSVRLPFWSAS
jgi:hypothetical protein